VGGSVSGKFAPATAAEEWNNGSAAE